MSINEIIKSRRSVRKYKAGETIPDEDIKAMLEAAMLAPSARNARPWCFTVLKNEEIKRKIAEVHRHAKHLKDASIGIIVCARKGVEEEDEFFEQDCGAAIENILLQAEEMGYGACWCGIYPNKHRMSEVASVLSLDATPIAVITVGKSDEEPKMRGFYDESLVTVI